MKTVFRVMTYGFLLLGVGLSIPAVAWPSIAEDMDLPIAGLGVVTLLYGAGVTVATLSGGWVSERSTTSTTLRFGAGIAAIGLLAVAVTPSWALLLVAIAAFGVGAGTIDAAINAYVAVRHGPREMGVVHGVFGVGAIIAPLLVTGLIAIGWSWRSSFATLGFAQLIFLAALLKFAGGISIPTKRSTGDNSKLGITQPLVWSITAFVAYAAVAASTGVWAFTYLTEEKGYADGSSGIIVAGYWAAFAASRFLLSLSHDRFDPRSILRWGMALTITGLLVFWLSPSPVVAVLGLIFSGFAHGPFFPLQMVLTPQRFGTVLAPTVIGYEIAAINVGSAAVPAFIGLFVASIGLEVVPPALVIAAVVLTITIEMLARTQRRRVPASG